MQRKLTILCLCVLILLLSLSACTVKGVTGDQWLLMQEPYMNDLQSFADGIDEVYSLYINGSITKEDFCNEVSVLKDQYCILKANYELSKENTHILPESYSYAAQRGVNGIENIYRIFEEVLSESFDEYGNPLPQSEISYLYLLKGQEINSCLADYITAYQIISSETEVNKNDN